MNVDRLLTAWRAQAAQYERDGVTVGARVLARCADELEGVEQEQDGELLLLADAEGVSGYSVDHLRRLIREQKLPAHRRGRLLLVRRADLPRKPHRVDAVGPVGYDPAADASRARTGRRHGGRSHASPSPA